MTNWDSESDKAFYETIRRDFESAKINENTMCSILRKYKQSVKKSDLDYWAHRDRLMSTLKKRGYDGEVAVDLWIDTRLVELEQLRTFVTERKLRSKI